MIHIFTRKHTKSNHSFRIVIKIFQLFKFNNRMHLNRDVLFT